MDRLSLVTLNANGLRSTAKRRALFSDLHNGGYDVIFLQETHSTPEDQKVWLTEWGGKGFFSHGRSNARGVATLFKKGFSPDVLTRVTDKEGRSIIIQIQEKDEVLTLANIYAPTQREAGQQEQFIGSLEESLADLEIVSLFMGGDFNVQLFNTTHNRSHPRGSTHLQMYINRIHAILEDYALADIWSVKNPSSSRGTFHRGSYSARLDYLFIPSSLLASSSIDILPHALSDHCMITLKVIFTQIKRGPGYWHLDNRLLSDKTFIKEMSAHITTLQQDRLPDHNLHWEWVKYKVKTFSINYSIQKKREETRFVRDLEDRLGSLAQEHDLTETPEVVDEAQSIKRELAEIKLSKANATILRSKARWSGLGEKPTAYFLGLERRKSKDNTVSALFSKTGRLIHDNQEILTMEKDYFTSIYAEDTQDLNPVDSFDLQTCIKEVVKEDQTGFIRGRSIRSNHRFYGCHRNTRSSSRSRLLQGL